MESYFESWWWTNIIHPSDALFVIGLICSLCLGHMAKCTAYTIWDNCTWHQSENPETFRKARWWHYLIGGVVSLLCFLFFWPIAALAVVIIAASGFNHN